MLTASAGIFTLSVFSPPLGVGECLSQAAKNRTKLLKRTITHRLLFPISITFSFGHGLCAVD
jgi:hypothetical protein